MRRPIACDEDLPDTPDDRRTPLLDDSSAYGCFKRNGGFALYGYALKDNKLVIEEKEAEAIRLIYEKFTSSDIGYGAVAKYMNLQGIKKVKRQNGICHCAARRSAVQGG